MNKIGIIGGTGIYSPELLKNPVKSVITTPYGKPGSDIISGTIGDKDVVMLFRHGIHHTLPPSEINYRANIYALKEAGCDCIIVTTACGSLRNEIERGDIVFPDQFIDFTKNRKATFFELFKQGEMKHTQMADPFSNEIRKILSDAAGKLNLKYHNSGTLITIEGPRFSSRAESEMFRIWGADIINMTTATEVILANELGISYAAIALSTDYDCWKKDEIPVSTDEIMKVFNNNLKNINLLIKQIIPLL
ncbi:MAG: S-methyl-5'-thioadenosine phosphorylase [Bacteroidota bacterium]